MRKKFNSLKFIEMICGTSAFLSSIFTMVVGIVMSLGSFMFYLSGMVGAFQGLFAFGITIGMAGYFGLLWFATHDKKNKGEL